MRTARQGTLDGLCGIYAVINALELVGVEYPRGSRLPRDLFRELIHGLGAVSMLAAMQDGLTADELVATATLAFEWLHTRHGYRLEITQPLGHRRLRSTRSFLAELRTLLNKPEAAVIISYDGPTFGHWTVARALTSTELQLRDSGGLGTLRLADFRRPGTRWRFRAADTLLVQRVG